MIRILQVIGSLELGGSQSMIMNIYRNINKEKIQFDFIIDHTENMYYKKEIEELGGKIYIMPTFVGSNLFEVLTAWNKFFKNHKEYNILHSHVRSYASLYIPIAKKFGLKTIIHSHSTSNGKGTKAIVKKFLQFPLRFQADYLIACSKESGEWLYGKKACLKDNFRIVSNAIDVNKFKYDLNIREKYRKNFNIEDNFVIGHVGRFHEAKNHLFLIDIFNEIVKEKENAILLLIGDGELRDKIELKISEHGLKEKVLLLGNRMDVHNLYQMMDAFLFPSLWEGLPLTVVEAQTSGIPCYLSSNITEEVILTELVERVSITHDIKYWANTVKSVDTNRENGYKIVAKSKYNIHNQIAELEKFYLDEQ